LTNYVDGPAGGTPLNAANLNRDFNSRPAKWAAGTPYVGGTDICVNPSGDLVSCTVSHTSGGSYDATKWALSATYALVTSVAPTTLDGGNATSVYTGTFNFDGGSAT
jgi:hypothetical protein